MIKASPWTRSSRTLPVLLLAGVVGLIPATRAVAHVAPTGCSASNLTFFLEDVPGQGPNGTVIDWNVTFSNTGTNGCNNTKINLDFCCPGPTDALLDPATAADCGAEPVHENCCVHLLSPTNCSLLDADPDAPCVAATPASAAVKMSCLSDPTTATGASCGYPTNSPATVQPFFSTQCRANANPGVLQINGAIVGTSAVHRVTNDNTADLARNLGFTPIPCDVKVDKQVCCAGGTLPGEPCATDSANWKDTGYDDSAINGCIGATGSTVHVRYKVKNNSGFEGDPDSTFPLFNCVLTESNGEIGGDINIGTLDAAQEITTDVRNPICSADLVAGEPNTATVTCDCVDDPETTFTATDSDTAKINCAAITTSKTCADQRANCLNAVTVTVTNQSLGNPDAPAPSITNCVVTDNVHAGAPSGDPLACSGPGTPVSLSAVSPATIAAGASGTAAGDASGLTSDSCNEESVTCDVVGGDGLTVSASATPKLCNVPIPDVAITKVCDPQQNQSNAVRITVTNTGSEVDVTNCKVVDTIYESSPTCPPGPGAVGTEKLNTTSGTIAKNGGTAGFSTSVANLTANACNQATVLDCESSVCNLVKANAQTPNDDIFSDVCETVAPQVSVDKECSDVPGDGTIFITVTNTGSQEALASCDVTDTFFANSATCPSTGGTSLSPITLISGSFPLATGAKAIYQTDASNFTSDSCDRAEATCTGADSGKQTSDTGTDVCPACAPDFTVSKDCDDAGLITVHVNNTGTGTLNCTATDYLFVDSDTCPADTTGSTTVNLLKPGTQDPCDLSNIAEGGSVTCTADVSSLINATSCDRVVVDCTPAECDVELPTKSDEATCPVGGCRVTGGGRIYSLYPDADCDPETDNNCFIPAAQDATHGGQVGASVGVTGTDLGLDGDGLGGACIKGEWEHVRHIRPRLRGNFHASRFDSLMCGCLGCLDENGRDSCTPSGDNDLTCPQGLVGNGLCFPTEPGNRQKDDRICGPEPRRAPANKICFTGVGDYTFTNGKRNRATVVFRVDIIDRSEPGGGFPGGSVDPPDRYRMRMWFLCDPNNPDNCLDPKGADVIALREAVACGDPLIETVDPTGWNPTWASGRVDRSNIDDGGDLDRGNHQLHPPTGAECTQ